ncbi:DUF4232 domain-containing protein [Streptomyces beijiangensis]|uniref:DUF4232 domain-containing protein n=1 Tax=Streptomyces beijiangensis TaxID=163361 RepID=A0A939FC04_9ACTN|nr:DUF4232 domain-containing protein [Streptomyces beijiangensis]MBO0515349.1 DUF4232 domain-containing protein [Streptomyces beijiangensis]
MRTYRKNAVLAAAAIAALSLGLTACGGSDTGAKDAGSATASQSSTDSGSTKTSGGTDSSTGKTADQTSSKSKGSTTGGSTGGTTSGGTGSTVKTPECTVGSLTYATTHKNAGKQDDHILITATNNTGSSCTLQKFPIITPGGANGDVPHSKKDSQVAQPLTVKPGKTVYSALALYPQGTSDLSFSSIRMSLNMNNVDDSMKSVTLNTGKAYYADAADGAEVYSWNPAKPYNY